LPDHDARKRLAKRIVREGMSVRGAEKAAQEGGAARKPRTATKLDPSLVARATDNVERVTGFKGRVNGGKLEIQFGDELRLEELVEVLESL
jgi:ParB-like chromosome segregation protein Spo0J